MSHTSHQCSLFRLSFQPIRPSQIVSEIYTLYYEIQSQAVLVTTTPEQFANQPGIITNPHPFVLSAAAAAAASTHSYDAGRTPIYICAFESKQPLLISVFFLT